MSAIAPLTLAMTLAPAAGIVLIALINRPRAAETINLVASAISLLSILCIVTFCTERKILILGRVRGRRRPRRLDNSLCRHRLLSRLDLCDRPHAPPWRDRSSPNFYALFAGFALTTLIGPLMNNAGLYWIAIELTTLVSTFLVAFEREASSIEAAWKYIIVVSAGISLALLGTILFYWSGTFVLGPTYDMTWDALRQAAPHLNPALVTLSFLLVLIGFGTKAGLAPMHTWLPDAHSEGPAPVSALLSGALLNTAMVGIVRYLAVADAAGIAAMARGTLLALGGFSLFVAALFIVRQTGIKRLMAYSSVEHMGVIALGFGFGGPFGVAGALYHMLNHSLNKSAMFFGAGSMMRAYGTKRIPQHSLGYPALSGGGGFVAGRSGRHHRGSPFRTVPERIDDHPSGSCQVRAFPGRAHRRPSRCHLCWIS